MRGSHYISRFAKPQLVCLFVQLFSRRLSTHHLLMSSLRILIYTQSPAISLKTKTLIANHKAWHVSLSRSLLYLKYEASPEIYRLIFTFCLTWLCLPALPCFYPIFVHALFMWYSLSESKVVSFAKRLQIIKCEIDISDMEYKISRCTTSLWQLMCVCLLKRGCRKFS